MSAYYNEIDPYAAQWLRNLIAAGHIAPGDVDERSIADVSPDDLRGYAQAHFFAGIGGWSLGARLAGWPDDRPLWTGSCPCQPFSVAGKGGAQADERHLWPVFFGLIRACRPDVVMGEQVAAAVGKDWLDGVSADLESIGYACGAAVVPACAVDAPHRRDRLWFVADADTSERRSVYSLRGRVEGQHAVPQGQEVADRPSADGEYGSLDGRNEEPRVAPNDAASASQIRERSHVGNPLGSRLEGQRGHGDDGREPGRLDAHAARPASEASGAVSDADSSGPFPRDHNQTAGHRQAVTAGHWADGRFVVGADGKARRVPQPGIRLLAHGVPARVGKLRAYGNAIVPQVAAEIIGAYAECRP